MAEDRSEPREINWRQLLPWTHLFQGFRVALDPNKLLLAAGGILAMAFGWWLLAIIFEPRSRPEPSTYINKQEKEGQGWADFKEAYQRWDLLHETAGTSYEIVGAGDLAVTEKEYETLNRLEQELRASKLTRAQVPAALDKLVAEGVINRPQADLWAPRLGVKKESAQLRGWPWDEDRGPNPFLLVTGQARNWRDPGQSFVNWLLTDQVPVLVEPLVKMFKPVIYFFRPGAGMLARFYFLLVMVWTLGVWAFFGGAITRIAAVQVTRQEKIGISEAIRFTIKRYASLVTAPLFPMVIVAILVVFMMIFGLFHMIPGVGDILVDGFFWWITILLGLAMAVVLVGLVGWPLMAATISTEGTDTWEAVSRSYSYVFQAPWHYIFYCVMALVYGAVIVFFVGFMGSFMVYLSKWGVSQGTWGSREPSYLFVYAPKSFQWRDLLLQESKAEFTTPDGRPEPRPMTVGGSVDQAVVDAYVDKSFKWYNHVGAFLVTFWLYLFFLLIVGFGYSYFWSASTIIYLLMRRKVDDAEMDEVYLEEEDQDLPFAPTPTPAPAPPPPVGSSPLQMVEAPTLRTPPPPPAPATASRPEQAPLPSATPPPPQNDGGNLPQSGGTTPQTGGNAPQSGGNSPPSGTV